MNIDSIRLINFQSFADSETIRLAKLTVLVGKNNSGKSSVLNGVRLLQAGLGPYYGLLRVGAAYSEIAAHADDIPHTYQPVSKGSFQLQINENGGVSAMSLSPDGANQRIGVSQFAGTMPNAVVLPLLAERSSRQFDEQVNRETARQVRPDMTNLSALISGHLNPSDPRFSLFAEASMALLGFRIGLIPTQNGQVPGILVRNGAASIPISAMGTGVVSAVRLLAYLLGTKDKIMLLEEPENDLHPEALKYVLNLVLDASTRNQVLVTTQSHIVLKTLGAAENCLVYRVDMHLDDGIPTSNIAPCDSPADRLSLLRELGHELSDFGLHDAFLILEEASAESIIKLLIRWFTPALTARLRTIAAYGVNDVAPRLSDLRRMFVFAHLEHVYDDRAWVLVDGDGAGKKVIAGLRDQFPSWDHNHFTTLNEENFELYYPQPFLEEARLILQEPNRKTRREHKEQLLLQILDWVESDDAIAKDAFESSAGAVIEVLRGIEHQLTVARQPQRVGSQSRSKGAGIRVS